MVEPESTDESDMTPDQRVAWLRQRGIEVVTPSERRAAEVAGALHAADGLRDTIAYVVVPADAARPLEERRVTVDLAHGTNALRAHIEPLFAAGGDTVDLTLLEQRPNQLLASSAGGGADGSQQLPPVSHETLRKVAQQAHVETFTLLHASPENRWTSVQILLDEVGMLKRLPLNHRAAELAARAGFEPPPQFFGDVVLSRCHYGDGGTVGGGAAAQLLDFSLADSRPDADWLRAAPRQNLAHQTQVNQATGAPLREQPAVRGTEGVAEAERDFVWTQTEVELEVRVPLEGPATAKDVQVRFAPGILQVLRPKAVSIDLFERVDVDSCTWTLEGDEIIISMEKQEAAFWPRIIN